MFDDMQFPAEQPIFSGTYDYGTVIAQDPLRSQLLSLGVTEQQIEESILVMAKKAQKALIKASYEEALTKPLLLNGVEWDAGALSPSYLDGEIRYQESIGGTSVEFVNYNNELVTLPLADAKVVASAVLVEFRNNFFKKQALYTNIDTASTVSEIEVIVW